MATVHICTDSLCCVQQILRLINMPATMRFSKHHDQLVAIVNLLFDRAKHGQNIAFLKVPAHAGIHGNEAADQMAKAACTIQDNDDQDPTPIWNDPSNANCRDRHYWPRVHGGSPPEQATQMKEVNDLTMDVKRHLCPLTQHGLVPENKQGVYAAAWREAVPNLDTQVSSHSMRSTNVPFRIQRALFKTHWGLHHCRLKMHLYNDNEPATCQLPGCNKTDCPNHHLGGCLNRDMKKVYISRHNEAVRIIQAAVRAGELGQSGMFMPAQPLTSRRALNRKPSLTGSCQTVPTNLISPSCGASTGSAFIALTGTHPQALNGPSTAYT